MVNNQQQALYRNDALALAALGAHLGNTKLPDVGVRLPKALADVAVAAWGRDHEEESDPEDSKQHIQRRRAGSLALIGLSIVNDGRPDGDVVVVGLQPGLIGDALDAADDPL